MAFDALRTTISRTEVIDISGGDHTFTTPPMWLDIYCSTAGNLVIRVQGDTADITLPCPTGTYEKHYRVSAVRQSSTIAGTIVACFQS